MKVDLTWNGLDVTADYDGEGFFDDIEVTATVTDVTGTKRAGWMPQAFIDAFTEQITQALAEKMGLTP